MPDSLAEFIQNLKTNRTIQTYDEAHTKQGIVLPLLSKLGWDPFNTEEVVPEYEIKGKRVDYALCLGSASKVFIEVKKPSEQIEDHQEQLLDYAFKQGVKLAVLTNGRGWWFYLPLTEGSWEQRKFYSVDIFDQEPDDVAARLKSFISREHIESGKAIENAQAVLQDRQNLKTIKDTLLQAWNRIISEQDDSLVELISDTTERLCGHKAPDDTVAKFLNENSEKLLFAKNESSTFSRVFPKSAKPPAEPAPKGFTGSTPQYFVFKGTTHKVSSWIEVLMKLTAELATRHRDDFHRILSLRGRKRPYFSEKSEVLRIPRKVSGTEIFAESNLSANSIVRLCKDLVLVFGHTDSDLRIHSD